VYDQLFTRSLDEWTKSRRWRKMTSSDPELGQFIAEHVARIEPLNQERK
jgi:hypothetical protein